MHQLDCMTFLQPMIQFQTQTPHLQPQNYKNDLGIGFQSFNQVLGKALEKDFQKYMMEKEASKEKNCSQTSFQSENYSQGSAEERKKRNMENKERMEKGTLILFNKERKVKQTVTETSNRQQIPSRTFSTIIKLPNYSNTKFYKIPLEVKTSSQRNNSPTFVNRQAPLPFLQEYGVRVPSTFTILNKRKIISKKAKLLKRRVQSWGAVATKKLRGKRQLTRLFQ